MSRDDEIGTHQPSLESLWVRTGQRRIVVDAVAAQRGGQFISEVRLKKGS